MTALAAATFFLGACGSDSDPSTPTDGARLQVAASTGVLADLAVAVAGPDATVTQIVPDGTSPHAFSLSASDRAEIGEASLLVAVGGDLEAGIPLDDLDGEQWRLLDHVPDPLPAAEGGGVDPHAWLDPLRTAAAIPALGDAFAAADPTNGDAYRQRGRRLAGELRALHREIERTLAGVPPAERKLVTSHDSLGYLADRYGFEVVATPFGATGPEGEVSATDLQEVIEAVREAGVGAVLAASSDDPGVLERVAAATGAEVRTGLLVESPGTAAGYAEMMRRNAEIIAQAP